MQMVIYSKLDPFFDFMLKMVSDFAPFREMVFLKKN